MQCQLACNRAVERAVNHAALKENWFRMHAAVYTDIPEIASYKCYATREHIMPALRERQIIGQLCNFALPKPNQHAASFNLVLEAVLPHCSHFGLFGYLSGTFSDFCQELRPQSGLTESSTDRCCKGLSGCLLSLLAFTLFSCKAGRAPDGEAVLVMIASEVKKHNAPAEC